MARHPAWLLGGALGAGYLVGGGFATPVARRIARTSGGLAWRFLVLPALQRTLLGLVGAGAAGGLPGQPGEDVDST
jgi:hypothetical protein